LNDPPGSLLNVRELVIIRFIPGLLIEPMLPPPIAPIGPAAAIVAVIPNVNAVAIPASALPTIDESSPDRNWI
jgi:hypothetical protein